MSEDLFRRAASELDALLAAARDDLERRGVAIADGSAPEALVWAYSFSTEREIGIERQRIACTLTLRGDAPPMMQSLAAGARIQHRHHAPVAWPELRRRGMAAIVEDTLASAQYFLQVKIGADFAHQEFIRRCESLLDLLGNDSANAPALREQVATWKTLAEQRSLYSAVRKTLIGNLDFGHLQDEAVALEDLYRESIYGPLSSSTGALSAPLPVGAHSVRPTSEPETDALSRRAAILDRIPKAPLIEDVQSSPTPIIGIVLGILAAALITIGISRHSWPLASGGAILFLLVVRALWQWHR